MSTESVSLAGKKKPVPLSFGLGLAALGVVFGDIGTSPLYAFRQCFDGGVDVSHAAGDVLGVLSLITWSLIVVVCVKYAGVILGFAHNGQGGTVALLALLQPASQRATPPKPPAVTLLALVSVGMLFGDGMITPAISVLSAVEGVKAISPGTGHFVVPISLAILLALFAFQSKGTQRIGGFFGPVMLVWFTASAVLGAFAIVRNLGVLRALDPLDGIEFFARHGIAGVLVMGGVVLTVTGCEALYADMSHLGRGPIVAAWYCAVFPSLLLNYYGQGAVVLSDPSALKHPYFALVPQWATIPMVLLATAATVIASQALISGVFTLSHQAMTSNFIPRLRTINTSRAFSGQVYVPSINVVLAACCLGLVAAFRSSAHLAAAYGLAVTITMAITTVMFAMAATRKCKWPVAATAAAAALFGAFDLMFLAGNLPKFLTGGWIPVAVSALVFAAGTAWLHGRRRFKRAFARQSMPVEAFVRQLGKHPRKPQAGVAVFLTGDTKDVPFAMHHHWLRSHAAYECVVLLTIRRKDIAFVPEDDRATVERLAPRLYRIIADVGFMQQPRLDLINAACKDHDLDLTEETITFFSTDPLVKAKKRGLIAYSMRGLYAALLLVRYPLIVEMEIPPDRCARLGLEVKL